MHPTLTPPGVLFFKLLLPYFLKDKFVLLLALERKNEEFTRFHKRFHVFQPLGLVKIFRTYLYQLQKPTPKKTIQPGMFIDPGEFAPRPHWIAQPFNALRKRDQCFLTINAIDQAAFGNLEAGVGILHLVLHMVWLL